MKDFGGRGTKGKSIRVPSTVCLLDVCRARPGPVFGATDHDGRGCCNLGGQACWLNGWEPQGGLWESCELTATTHIPPLRKEADKKKKATDTIQRH